MPRNARTACPANSVWQPVSESTFQEHIAKLWKATSGKPKDPAVYELPAPGTFVEDNFPLAIEVQLAKGFAFIAEVRRGVECVSAAAIEWPRNPVDGSTINLASNSQIRPEVEQKLKQIALIMQDSATDKVTRTQCKDLVLQVILQLNMFRINDRLRSRNGSKPIVLQGLSEILKNLQKSDGRTHHSQLIARVESLCVALKQNDTRSSPSKQIRSIQQVVVACRKFCTAADNEEVGRLLRAAGIDLDRARGDPTIRQICKVAAYSYIADMFAAVTSNPKLRRYFLKTNIRFINAYDAVRYAMPRVIDGGDRSCRVHAEIQLVVDLDIRSDAVCCRPRAICSGKAACFLCELFINQHGVYFVSETHGKLTPHWTIPDLDVYDPCLRDHYRSIISAMSNEICGLARHPYAKRLNPAMSWLGLSQLHLHPWLLDTNGDLKASLLSNKSNGHPTVRPTELRMTDPQRPSTPREAVYSSDLNLPHQNSHELRVQPVGASSHIESYIHMNTTNACRAGYRNAASGGIADFGSQSNYATEQLTSFPVRSSIDLSGGQQYSVATFMKGHGSRTTDSLPLCVSPESQSYTLRESSEAHSGNESRWIDLHEIELLIELEPSTSALNVFSCTPIETQVTEMVNVNDLRVDREMSVHMNINQERCLYLVLRKASKQALWWKISWRN